MKILMLNWRDLSSPRSGGAEVLTEGILSRLASRGHDVTLLSSLAKRLDRYEERNGFKIIRAGSEITVRFHAWRLWRSRFRHEKFDIVIDQIHGVPFFTPWYLSDASNSKLSPRVFAFIHEVAKEIWLSMLPFPLGRLGYMAEPHFFRPYKHIPFITVSHATKRDLESVGIPSRNISIIPEAISDAYFRNEAPLNASIPVRAESPTLLYIGRLAPMKQLEKLLETFGLLQEKIPDVRLWIVGSGQPAYTRKLQSLAAKHNSKVTFWGFVEEAKKREMLRQAHLLVSCSIKEGFGLVVLEAAASGTPSVVYASDGFSEAVKDGQTGILAKENTPQDLAKNIEKLLQDKNLYDTLSRNAIAHAQNFSFEKAADEFEKIITTA